MSSRLSLTPLECSTCTEASDNESEEDELYGDYAVLIGALHKLICRKELKHPKKKSNNRFTTFASAFSGMTHHLSPRVRRSRAASEADADSAAKASVARHVSVQSGPPSVGLAQPVFEFQVEEFPDIQAQNTDSQTMANPAQRGDAELKPAALKEEEISAHALATDSDEAATLHFTTI